MQASKKCVTGNLNKAEQVPSFCSKLSSSKLSIVSEPPNDALPFSLGVRGFPCFGGRSETNKCIRTNRKRTKYRELAKGPRDM